MPAVGIRLHQPHQGREALTAHDAVRVQDDHVPVLAAPAPAEVRDVAALSLDVVPAPAIEDRARTRSTDAHRSQPRLSLRHQRVGLGAVAENEEVEVLTQTPCAGDRLVCRADTREHARDVLVANRHDDRRARLGRDGGRRGRRSGDGVAVTPQTQEHEPAQRRPESERHPREQDREEAEDRQLRAAAARGTARRCHHEVRERRRSGPAPATVSSGPARRRGREAASRPPAAPGRGSRAGRAIPRAPWASAREAPSPGVRPWTSPEGECSSTSPTTSPCRGSGAPAAPLAWPVETAEAHHEPPSPGHLVASCALLHDLTVAVDPQRGVHGRARTASG